ITDGYGTSKFSQPVMIYDKIDGWKGFFPYGIDGVQFLLSWDSNRETGLYHSYTDSSVVNGIRYFYAVTSYDHGEIERRIPPSECSKYATIDENGNIQTAKNVATVIPGPRPTGYKAAMVDTLMNGESLLPYNDVKGTGKVFLQILKPDSVADGRTYQLQFIDQAHDQIDNNFNWRCSIDLDSNGVIELNKDAIFDDVGQDGDPATADYGFGDGKPTTGEPNVDENDPDEFYPYTSGYYVVDMSNSSRPDTVKFVPFVEASPFMKTAIDTVTIIGTNGQPQRVLVQHQVNTTLTDTVMVTLDDTLFIQSQADTIVNRLVDLDTRDIFNGVRLTLANDRTAVVIDPTTYQQATYSAGFPTLYYGINFKPFEFANFEKGIEYPRDYMVVFYDHIVDTSDVIMLQPTNPSKPKVPLPAKPVKFKVFDTDTKQPLPFGFIDDQIFQNPGDITGNDKIIFYEKSPNGTQIPTWAIIFVPKDVLGQYLADTMAYVMNDYIGADGPDTLVVTTKKPFRTGDVFQFSLRAPAIGAASGNALDRITVVPNPYIVYSNFETFDYNVSKHKLKFMGLPARCTIRIYNLNGYLVDTIEHQSTEDGTADWDLLTSEGLEISYGIYIYHVDAPGIGKKIGKFAVIK
ncbi:MAG: hypothetical protein KBA26_10755, partial [Candidatus Delongbacteria bacterium]|nr:hypothetical protein [Candidatus Delongbacteria bacterium]